MFGKTIPSLVSVCPPPDQLEKKTIVVVPRCSGCGNGPYKREMGKLGLCSKECDDKLARKRESERKRFEQNTPKGNKKSKKARQREKRRLRAKQAGIPRPKLNFLEQKYGQSFYTADAWLHLRYQALEKYGAWCGLCGRAKSDGATLHVDHIKPRSKYPELEMSLDNLQVLCDQCNLGKSNYYETDWRTRKY